MKKQCTRCGKTKHLEFFTARAASRDGYTAACTRCLDAQKTLDYYVNPERRAAHLARIARNRKERAFADPIYQKSLDIWTNLRKRGYKASIPPWAKLADFYDHAARLLLLGPEYTSDHIIPLKHAKVCGLHVPWNLQEITRSENSAKWNHFETDWD